MRNAQHSPEKLVRNSAARMVDIYELREINQDVCIDMNTMPDGHTLHTLSKHLCIGKAKVNLPPPA